MIELRWVERVPNGMFMETDGKSAVPVVRVLQFRRAINSHIPTDDNILGLPLWTPWTDVPVVQDTQVAR